MEAPEELGKAVPAAAPFLSHGLVRGFMRGCGGGCSGLGGLSLMSVCHQEGSNGRRQDEQ